MPIKKCLFQLFFCELVLLFLLPTGAFLQFHSSSALSPANHLHPSVLYSPTAQPPDQFFIQQLNNRNGLSNSAINHIYKDADNVIWVATWDGLNMYDGTSFHVFNYGKENDSRNIGSNVIRHITEDKFKNIWISTIEGISRFEKNTGKFHNYFYSQNQRSSISEQEYELVVDKEGAVFCLTSGYGLTCYDAAADTFRICQLPGSSSRITRLAFDNENRLWVVTENGSLQVFANTGHDLRLIKVFPAKDKINHFFKTNGRLFYSTASDLLVEIDTRTMAQRPVLQLKHPVTSLVYYKDHYLLAWNTKGYGVYDNQFVASGFLDAEARQMQEIKVMSMTQGSEQILWLGTDGNGIIKIYPRTKSFGTYSTADNGNPYNKSVRAFCEENDNLWFGTKGNGIVRIRKFWSGGLTGTDKQYFQAPAQLDNNSVFALKKGLDNLIFIGTDGTGIGVFDEKTQRFSRWSDIKGHDLYPEFGSVYAIWQDADRSLWLGTSGYGLIHIKIGKDAKGVLSVTSQEQYTFNKTNTGPANDIIYALADAGNDQLWIGCRYGGLSLLDKKSRHFRTFKAFTHEGSLTNNDVLSVYRDSHKRVWVGTSYGLNRMEGEIGSSEPLFRKLTTADGLPNNTIHSITEDSAGYIWVSTNRGLAKVEPTNFKISTYQQVDGLQSNEFCDGAVWKDRSGQLFFGGTYGFNYFHPQNISKTNWLPNLLVSDIVMGGKSGNGNSFEVVKTEGFTPLSYAIERKEDFFELNVKALSFLNAEKCEYAYNLEGYDKIWHYSGIAGKITYSNIPPGNYTLKIKWSNGEGTWTKEIPVLNLAVKQYFWLTIYAFLVYALMLALVGYVIFNYQRNKQEIKNQLAVEHLMRTREEELHQDRISFFTNIAHELQTPLTLIMGSIERFMDKTAMTDKASVRTSSEKPYFLSLIHQQASRLTYLVHQLLEFRKGEAGFALNQYSFLNISELLTNLGNPFITLSEQNQMSYDVDISQDLVGWIDKDKLEKIIFNLLSNAFKHSQANEKILFAASKGKLDDLEITVANSGNTLPPEQLNKLFDKFYTADSKTVETEKFGTGIGLAFTRQLVTLLDGSIKVSSTDGWISFTVNLPLTADNQELQSTDTNHPLAGKPSYLYQAVTSYSEPLAPVTAIENNKLAILENLEENNRKNILVVEDESDIRFLLKDMLKDDYIVYEAEDGLKAIELMRRIVPDLIICDVRMPNMNGLELCNKIKDTPATCHIPFIILSARDSVEQHMEGYEVGADAYIAKPFHTAHLKIRIRKLLEQKQKLYDFFKNDNATDTLVEADLPDDDKQFLSKLVIIIEENMDQPELSVAEIEKKVAMSRMQLYRKLKTLTGMTPSEFIKHIRLKHASHLLATTKLTVSEIFYRTGFNSQSYFFREFKKRYHCAPNEYRLQHAL